MDARWSAQSYNMRLVLEDVAGGGCSRTFLVGGGETGLDALMGMSASEWGAMTKRAAGFEGGPRGETSGERRQLRDTSGGGGGGDGGGSPQGRLERLVGARVRVAAFELCGGGSEREVGAARVVLAGG